MLRLPGGSSSLLAFLEHDCDPVAWEQLLGSLQSLGLISSKNRHHGDVIWQVSDHVDQQGQAVREVLELPCWTIKVVY